MKEEIEVLLAQLDTQSSIVVVTPEEAIEGIVQIKTSATTPCIGFDIDITDKDKGIGRIIDVWSFAADEGPATVYSKNLPSWGIGVEVILCFEGDKGTMTKKIS